MNKFIRDILTDDSDEDFDMPAVFAFFAGVSMILFAGYDLYMSYHIYEIMIANKITPLPAPPTFNFQGFGIALGAVLTGLGAHSLMRRNSDGENKGDRDEHNKDCDK